VCVVLALAWANSPFRTAYHELWSTHLSIQVAAFRLDESLLHWINDGLMALFFFVVGLEIKREVVAGELAEPRKAMLPIAGALGGMVVPAAIYATINAGGPGVAGWGVPMATDIAFAVAAVSVLGSRVPTSLKVFLTALAIVDDLGAILVIAVFYADGVAWAWLGVGAAGLALCAFFNARQIRSPIPYALAGLGVWAAFLQSGVHATIAGVLVALTIPARRRLDSREFLRRSTAILQHFEEASEFRSARLVSGGQQSALGALEEAVEHVQTPLQRLEGALHPWVVFGVLPLFALANAGVSIEGSPTGMLGHPVALGVIAGLVMGKSAGITLFAWGATRLGLAALPPDARWIQLHGVAWLAGIGFTMSLFIAGLAFGEGELMAVAKLAILVASVVACLGGLLVLLVLGSNTTGRQD
jgi:NhaA family Na+:H+ antiporter